MIRMVVVTFQRGLSRGREQLLRSERPVFPGRFRHPTFPEGNHSQRDGLKR